MTKEFIGNTGIRDYLARILLKDAFSNAYLFTGPEHIGKRTLAELFIRGILCEQKPRVLGGCGVCTNCLTSLSAHPDAQVVEREKGKTRIDINQIRACTSGLSVTPWQSSMKAAMIDHADLMNEESANALLKTLEEPSLNSCIILLTEDVSALPETIASRTQILHFLPVPRHEIEKSLSSDDTHGDLVGSAHHRPGLTLGLSKKKQDAQRDLNRELLQLLQPDREYAFIEKRLKGSTEKARAELLIITESLISFLRDLLFIHIGLERRISNAAHIETLKAQLPKYPRENIIRLLGKLRTVRRDMKMNVSPKLLIESFFAQLP